MSTKLSFYIALTVAIVSVIPPFFIPCTDAGIVTGCTQRNCANYDPNAVIDDGSCEGCDEAPMPESCVLNSNFEVQFDNALCAVVLIDVADPGCVFEASTDNGQSWEIVSSGNPVFLTGTGNCDIVVRTVENPDVILPYQGDTTCDCTPPVDDESIKRVVEDPLQHFLDSRECRCSDYTFIFPNNLRINAVEATLYLRMQWNNGQRYTISEIDHDNQEVNVVQRPSS